MKSDRKFTRGFRPSDEALERVEYVEKLGVFPEFVNGLIVKFGRQEIVEIKKRKSAELQRQADELRSALDAPVP